MSPIYPIRAHSSKIDYKKTIEDVLIKLSIYVTPEDKFSVKFQSIFKSFLQINTRSYSKLLQYTKYQLTKKLLSQGFIETRLISTLEKLFGRYHHLTLPYRVSVTTMANDICRP